MAYHSIYKPRYSLVTKTKTKIRPYKDSYVRRFYEQRARRIRRVGLFERCVLVATTVKWKKIRRFRRPFSRPRISFTQSFKSTAYGRPRKRRYQESFYQKQKIRFFYGKVKEDAFLQFFRYYRNVIGKPSTSFFSVLESRLDRVFFRRRLLPTIYSCHQFIQHKGLLVNGSLETSPRAIISVGDTVEIPSVSWKPFYWDLFCRVFYRRWGLFVQRRRLYTQLKKKLFILNNRRNNWVKYYLNSGNKKYTVSKFYSNKSRFTVKYYKTKIKAKQKSVNKLKANFEFNNNRVKNIKRFFSRIDYNSVYSLKKKYYFSKNRQIKNYNIIRAIKPFNVKRSIYFSSSLIKSQNRSFFIKQGNPNSIYADKRVRYQIRKPFVSAIKKKSEEVSVNKKLQFLHQFDVYTKYIKDVAFTDIQKQKVAYLQKLLYSRRLRKALLPVIKKKQTLSGKRVFFRKDNNFSISRFRRFKRKFIKKQKQLNKTPRIKAVHLYIPSYLQVDFRTLRAVKIQSPNFNEIFYPFRASFAKRSSFYKARGR